MNRADAEALLNAIENVLDAFAYAKRQRTRNRGFHLNRAQARLGALQQAFADPNISTDLQGLMQVAHGQIQQDPLGFRSGLEKRKNQVLKDEGLLLGNHMQSRDLLAAIDSFLALPEDIHNQFPQDIHQIVADSILAFNLAIDEYRATAGRSLMGRKGKKARRQNAKAMLHQATHALALLAGNGPAPQIFPYSYACAGASRERAVELAEQVQARINP